VLASSLVLLASPGTTVSQEPTGIKIGSRVRVKAEGAGQRWVIGELLELSGDSVRLLTGDPPDERIAVATRSLASFERSRGQRSRAGKGAWIGLGAGVALGFILGVATYEECSGFCPAPDLGPAGGGTIVGVLGGLFGLGVGALIGRSIQAEQWESARRPWAWGREQPLSRRTIGVSVGF
jgi:hypothetical protein